MLCQWCNGEHPAGECPGFELDFAPEPKSGRFGSAVRAQVLEVIVRQAIAGVPWREICMGPMQVNRISVQEVEEEIRRRGSDPGSNATVRRGPYRPPSPFSSIMKLFKPDQDSH